jgi:3-oxoadipate enol-lactonase
MDRRALIHNFIKPVLFACSAAVVACAESEAGVGAVNGTKLYYERSGDDGLTLVMIHGFTLDSRLFDLQVEPFSNRMRVLRYDARGFGRSGPITEPFSTSEDLRALLDSFGVQKAGVLGVSMGGRYAIDFALTYPERVSFLVVADPGLSGQPLPTIAAELAPAVAAAQSGNMRQAKDIWFGSSIFSPAREQPGVEAHLRAMLDDYSGWHFINGLAAQEIPISPPAVGRLSEIQVPTLGIIGERDVEDVRVIIDKIAAEVPNARAVTLPTVGHFTNIEAPEAFNQAVFDWLGLVAAQTP